MKLREYLLNTASIDVLMALNSKIHENRYEIVNCLAELIDPDHHDYTMCDNNCNKCMCELLNKEVNHEDRTWKTSDRGSGEDT